MSKLEIGNMENIIKQIYNNAISKVFANEILTNEFFDNECYKEMIDDSHSIVIWGNEDSECGEIYKDYIISIRSGAINTEDGLFGIEEIICDETSDNTYESLYMGIKEVIEKYFCNNYRIVDGEVNDLQYR